MTTPAATAPVAAHRAASELEDLVRAHLSIVGNLVRETLGRLPAHVGREDLISAGMVALVSAAKAYNPERGVPFGGFAAVRIRGALLDELRSADWASRSVRSRARRVDAAQQTLATALGRTPTPQELAESLNIAVDELVSVDEDVQRAVVLSLQGGAVAAEEVVAERTAGPEELLVHRERIGYLHHAIQALPEKLRRVVMEYFFAERPMAEIADELGVSESRVSQLRGEALALLRDGLNSQLDPELVADADRPGGCVARRRTSYFSAIATVGDLRSRLAVTNHLGVPVAAAA